jgi:hypothetical protein
VALLFEVLLRHAHECRVIPGNQWDAEGAGLFLVDLQADVPPEACAGMSSPVSAKEPHLLDAREALASMRKRLSSTPARVRMQSLEAMLLRHLLPEGRDVGACCEPRLPDGRNAGLLLGLETIHYHLLAVAAPAWQQTDDGPGPGPVEAVSCRVLDSSKGGIKLVCESGVECDVCVGGLLAVVEGNTGAQTLLFAMVRSLQEQPEGGMEIGVQLMQGGLGPVFCNSPGDHETAVHALFMLVGETGETGATLVTAKGFYETGRHLLIDVGGRKVNARAGRLVVDSPVNDRFEFSMA